MVHQKYPNPVKYFQENSTFWMGLVGLELMDGSDTENKNNYRSNTILSMSLSY